MSIVLRIGAVKRNTFSCDPTGQDAANSDTDAQDIPIPEEVSYRPTPTKNGCFGLPYQDHNYGAQPPRSPSPPPSPVPAPPPPAPFSPPPVWLSKPPELEEEAKVPLASNEEEVVEDSVTRCICGFLHDDGYMVQCETCSVWQHVDCVIADKTNMPETYFCEKCVPREMDCERAKAFQLRRREELDTSATDTDPEEPANALASLGRKPAQPKAKGAKQRRVSKTGSRLLKGGKLGKSPQMKRDKLKLTKKEKENMKDVSKKQKMAKSNLPKPKKIKKKLNLSLSQNKADQWLLPIRGRCPPDSPTGRCHSSPPGTPGPLHPICGMEEIKENEYSPEVLDFLAHAKTNGIHSPHSIGVFPEELMVKLYQVADVKNNHKGLEATELITPGKAIIDFKGKVMLRQHFHRDPLFNPSQPYVLYYSKFEGLDLCIDASALGGDARFLRRSCSPNAEMCHIIDNGKLLFIVQAKKEISKGSEITIPFDFNYQDAPSSVECACGKANCPVSRFWKKLTKLCKNKSPEKPKRKRQASGEGRAGRTAQCKESPVKTPKSPCKNHSPVRNCTLSPLSFAHEEPIVSVDSNGTSLLDFLPEPVPIKLTPVARRSSRAPSDSKEEKEVKAAKPAPIKELPAKAPATHTDNHNGIHSSCTESSGQNVSESEADSAGECPKKLTREEKKLEAIMKAFEKMEKRDERRKEALARINKRHESKEEPCDRSLSTDTASTDESLTEKKSEVLPPQAPDCPKPMEMEAGLVIKMEDNPSGPECGASQKVAKQKKMKRKRRNSRAMSAIEPLYHSPPPPPPPKIPAPVVSPEPVALPLPVEVKEEPPDPVPLPVTSYSAPNSAPIDPPEAAALDLTDSNLFHRKKKYLFADWSGPRTSEGRSESMESREEEMFVSYMPSPRNAMDHLQRRNSTSAALGRASDSARGSAKKRWLRQAMYETPIKVETSMMSPQSIPVVDDCPPPHTSTPAVAPVPAAAPAPATATATVTPLLPSPSGSPSDFVTPLKKRRLALEFQPSTSSAVKAITLDHPELSQASTSNCEVTGSSVVLDPPAKFRRLCSRGNVNSVDSTNSKVLTAEGPDQRDSTSPPPAPAGPLPPKHEELSLDGLRRTGCPAATVPAVSAGRWASWTVGQAVDSACPAECSESSPAAVEASTSRGPCLENSHDSGIEMPLVDSSGATLETDTPEARQQRLRGSDSVSICSSDNEASLPGGQDTDVDPHPDAGCRRDIAVVAESSSACVGGRASSGEDQNADISESRPVENTTPAVEEGNEAAGDVSGSEETEVVRYGSGFNSALPNADCQVNSSQDCSCSNRATSEISSPSQLDTETNDSRRPHSANRNCDNEDLGATVSSALDNSAKKRTRFGVSSAQDVSVSSVVPAHESEDSTASDMECGPSSSSQIHLSRREEPGEEMVCNSSDVSASHTLASVVEEDSVDSTTQSSRGWSVLCDTARVGARADSEGSCCDSNSERSGTGAGVRWSGPADSQCDEVTDSSVVTGGGGCVVSSSLLHSASVVTTSSSLLSAWESDAPCPSQSSAAAPLNCSPSVSSLLREVDSVGTSQQLSGPASEHCEPSTSSGNGCLSATESLAGPPVSSSPPEAELAVSSGTAMGDSLAVNGDCYYGGMVSSLSADSPGIAGHSQPCATVSSSEALAAPAAKRKVSLSEYRSRRKEKSGSCCNPCPVSPKRSAENHLSRSVLDSAISLAPLPLFEPITIKRESRSAKGKRRSSLDIPPPPPPPPNGVLSGLGARRSSSSASRSGALQKEEDRPKASGSKMAPSSTAGSSGAGRSLSRSRKVKKQGASAPTTQGQPGYSWLAAKLQGTQARTLGARMAGPARPLPSSTTTSASFPVGVPPPPPQQHAPIFNGPARLDGSRLPNGSVSSASCTFPAPPVYQAQSSFKPQRQQAGAPPPPPPPPPSTAYPSFLAQSRTAPLHNGSLGGGQPTASRVHRLSRPSSVPAGPVGNGTGLVRQAAAEPSSSTLTARGHFHFDQFSHNQTVKHKNIFSSDRSQHQ